MTPSESTYAAADEVTIHGVGRIALSCCAPRGMSREVVEVRVNEQQPTGGCRWRIATRAGRNNPIPCPCDVERQHWLLRC